MKLCTKAAWSLAAAFCFALLCVTSAGAQTVTTGDISGTVVDGQGGVLPGATVTATHTDTGTSYEAVTGVDGRYNILNVRVGTYTIDPRGLVGGPDLDETKLDMMDWQDHVRETQSSLRVIADLTGGFAVVNQNDFDKALKRIDGETSDYYVLGYYSTNPDPLKKRRNIEIKVKAPGRYELNYKPTYTLKPPPAIRSSSK